VRPAVRPTRRVSLSAMVVRVSRRFFFYPPPISGRIIAIALCGEISNEFVVFKKKKKDVNYYIF